jgi:hypothetical protein
MPNQSLRRLQDTFRKLACHALLANPMPSRLAQQSEILWLQWTERIAAIFEGVPSAILLWRTLIRPSVNRMQSLGRRAAPFYFGHKNRKVT